MIDVNIFFWKVEEKCMDFDPYRYDFEKYFEKLIKRKKALNRKQTNKQKDKKDILLLDFVMENL